VTSLEERQLALHVRLDQFGALVSDLKGDTLARAQFADKLIQEHLRRERDEIERELNEIEAEIATGRGA
jgi:hypothetical protein